ncbi:MAG: DUF1292 domain-containing protein [Ruminococcaceae bacterium]|nr:DUF1292 domain-containing protein [Oscillospiraceae bacterium]
MQEEETTICMLQDENGDEHEFEVIAQCEYQGATYYAMIPALNSDMDDEFCEYVILKELVDENGEESLVSIDDNEDEFNAVADIFDNLFDEEVDYDTQK